MLKPRFFCKSMETAQTQLFQVIDVDKNAVYPTSVNHSTSFYNTTYLLITLISSSGWCIKKSGFCFAHTSFELKPQLTAIAFI